MDCVYDDSEILGTERYTCTLADLDYDFSTPFYFIRVGGQHASGRTNEDVRNLRIRDSTINRIPANIFSVFPNIEALEVFNCGSLNFIPPDFYFANNLREVRIVDNTIPALMLSPFTGVPTLETLILDNNGLTNLGPAPFVNLGQLRTLSIANNQIRLLTPRFFTPLRSLRTFDASNNAIEEIEGRIFSNSPDLEIVNLSGNNINAVGLSILNINENLQQLWLEGNRCANQNFVIGENVNLGVIREALSNCFANSRTGTQIAVNVVGNLIIYDENDQVLLRVE